METIKGWRTVAFGVVTAAAPPALTYLFGVDWTTLGISPPVAAVLGSVIIALRAITTTPIGRP
jgi:hypothetical protein